MVKDTLNSMLDNIKERTTNPFLGTLIIVWVIKNWTLVYSLFYFDSAFKLEDRLNYISHYFSNHSFIWNMFYVILITLAVLILTYILLSVSRLVTDTQERIVIPIISKWTDKSSVVLKTEYVKLQELIKLLEIRLEEERQAKSLIQNERDLLDKKVLELGSPISEDEYYEQRIPEPNQVINNNGDNAFIRVSNKALNEWGKESFNNTINRILNGYVLSSDTEDVKTLLRELLIVTDGGDTYKLTERGIDFLAYWNEISANHVDEELPF